jgi:hypothetical protein
MAIWIGLFVNNVDGGSVRMLEVNAISETEALTKLDFYEYDETWQRFSFVEVYKKRKLFSTLLVDLKQVLLNYIELLDSLASRKHRGLDSSN